MTGDFSDEQGLADWLGGFDLEPAGPTGPGEPAYPVSFGWLPPLIPLPRRAPDDLF